MRAQFARTAALLPPGVSAALVFVLGARSFGGGPPPSPLPSAEVALGDTVLVDCADSDGPNGMANVLVDSSTTCKVAAGMVHAVGTYRFHYLARVGDDALFRFDAFLAGVGAAHVAAGDNLALAYWMQSIPQSPYPAQADMYGGPPGFPLARLLPYPGGMGYVFSYNITAGFAELSTRVGLADGVAEDQMAGFWVAALGRQRVTRVHTPCFHNHAEWVPAPLKPAGFAKYLIAGECTPSSLLVHYMTPELWGRVGGDGVLRGCGSLVSAGYCGLPPWKGKPIITVP